MGTFTHPLTNKTYLFGSDVNNGKVERFRVDNLNTIQRTNSTFNWTVPIEMQGSWKFDDNLLDASGNNHGVFVGGSPTYVNGLEGKALSLNGQNQSVQVASPLSIDSSYTISAWIKPTDVTNTNILVRVGNHGDMAVLRLNSSGQFEHSASAILEGASRICDGHYRGEARRMVPRRGRSATRWHGATVC